MMSQLSSAGPAPAASGEIMAKPRKMDQYIAEGRRLVEVVAAYREARDAASPVSQPDPVDGELSPAPAKKKSYRLPPLDRPTELPDWPLNPPQDIDLPDYGNLARVKAIRATQAARRGKKAPMTPIGPSELRKRGQ
jgi:hypothetical protein